MAGTGKHNDEEELTGTSHRSRTDFGDPGRRITVTDLEAILRPQDPTKLKGDKVDVEETKRRNYISERIDKDFDMVDRIEKLIHGALTTNPSNADIEHPASSFHKPLATKLPDAAAGQRTKEKPKTPPTLYTYNYKQKYTAWRYSLKSAKKSPTAEQ